MQLRTLSLAFALCLGLGACGGGGGAPAPAPPATLNFTTIEEGSDSGIHAREFASAANDTAWAALWARHKVFIKPTPARPVVDFARESVAGIFLGSDSVCTRVQVDSVTVEQGPASPQAAQVNYRVTRPISCVFLPGDPMSLVRVSNPDRLPLTFRRLPDQDGTLYLQELAVGESRQAPEGGLAVKVLGVEDSRCPLVAECITRGSAVVRLEVNAGNQVQIVSLSTQGDRLEVAGWELRLGRVDPYPEQRPAPAEQLRVDVLYRRL